MLAATEDTDIRVLQALAERCPNMDINRRIKNETALNRIAHIQRCNFHKKVKCLVSAGANVNICCPSSPTPLTPLQRAFEEEAYQNVEHMLRAEKPIPDVHVKVRGKTLIQLARELAHRSSAWIKIRDMVEHVSKLSNTED